MFKVDATSVDVLSAKFSAMPAAVQTALVAKAGDLAMRLQAHVVRDKLSGQVLQSKTGALKASIMTAVESDGDSFRVRVFSSGVKYAAIQEYGGQTPPHEIVPDKAKALVFMVGGKQVFAKLVHHPVSHIPPRAYLGSALADMAGQISAELKAAVVEAMR